MRTKRRVQSTCTRHEDLNKQRCTHPEQLFGSISDSPKHSLKVLMTVTAGTILAMQVWEASCGACTMAGRGTCSTLICEVVMATRTKYGIWGHVSR